MPLVEVATAPAPPSLRCDPQPSEVRSFDQRQSLLPHTFHCIILVSRNRIYPYKYVFMQEIYARNGEKRRKGGQNIKRQENPATTAGFKTCYEPDPRVRNCDGQQEMRVKRGQHILVAIRTLTYHADRRGPCSGPLSLSRSSARTVVRSCRLFETTGWSRMKSQSCRNTRAWISRNGYGK